MATVIKHNINGIEYNYLSYSYRKDGKVLKKERYIGRDIPPYDDMTQIWEELSHEIVEERWIPQIEEIKINYQNDLNRMPLPIKAKNLRSFGIRFTHHSNKIEGSTLTLREVEKVVNEDVTPSNRSLTDILETKAHMNIYEKMINTNEKISMDLICKWHKELFQTTDHNSAGIIRNYTVYIGGSHYEPPMTKIEIEMLLDVLFSWYHQKKTILHPVFLAAVMHYNFVAIHPFGDGNGRMARLLTNYILHKNNYPMFDVDARIRDRYYKALERSDQKDYALPFIQWFFKYYIINNKKYLSNIISAISIQS